MADDAEWTKSINDATKLEISESSYKKLVQIFGDPNVIVALDHCFSLVPSSMGLSFDEPHIINSGKEINIGVTCHAPQNVPCPLITDNLELPSGVHHQGALEFKKDVSTSTHPVQTLIRDDPSRAFIITLKTGWTTLVKVIPAYDQGKPVPPKYIKVYDQDAHHSAWYDPESGLKATWTVGYYQSNNYEFSFTTQVDKTAQVATNKQRGYSFIFKNSQGRTFQYTFLDNPVSGDLDGHWISLIEEIAK